ncbi:glycerol-3-phosphate dehydrogenase [Chelatococcus composti]|uniref:Glycerol-3-phosphate dehydrogenase n=1 Tax=Chelatococcus composti TaxID=1743235 RepID=A0A841K9L5_9HYPH|nr:glycerol-3-phosphate dehydrogenase [Chelatococcus composti]MBB6167574.1 glycerol-3-phosphate dehydrogenase [Chelatococcus composti]GGG32906.1 glycerol-3-phosphate dehydrogenase [Chelatococcus composti]
MREKVYDLAVIGGGVNGCGIARDAAGRGLATILFEQGDLAGATSSASTKLIHGGLRYLEYYEFRLVREALMEREVLWRLAPHIIRPLRFVLPHHAGLRPAWMLRLGLFLYDHLGGRKLLPATRSLDLRHDPAGAPLKPGYSTAFEYSDCWVDDARLVVLNARDAADRGAAIHPRTRVVGAERRGDHWLVTAERRGDGARLTVKARMLVNAAGPWVAEVLAGIVREKPPAGVRLVQGSHIVVPRLYDHDRCYIFQNGDGRIIFAIPYEHDFTLIGTTDRDYHGDPAAVAASEEEIGYLCSAASEYFARPVRSEDVVWTYSGVRPLYDDGATKAQEATRDYVLKREGEGREPLLLSVFGGKITTYRRLAEAALDRLAPQMPEGACARAGWTAQAPLAGGDFPPDGLEALVRRIREAHPYLAEGVAARLARSYGTRAFTILDGARSAADLGRQFGAGLSEREVDYLMREEWAMTAEDVLWRRSKLGLRLTREEAAVLEDFMAARLRQAA